jgi:hypothetical protein
MLTSTYFADGLLARCQQDTGRIDLERLVGGALDLDSQLVLVHVFDEQRDRVGTLSAKVIWSAGDIFKEVFRIKQAQDTLR